MPNVIQGSPDSTLNGFSDVTYNYEYPDGLNLKPGGDLHSKVKAKILDRARESYGKISARFSSWRETDQTLTAYKYVDDDETKVKKSDSRKPVSIVFPYTYAVNETLLTYMTQAFFQDYIFRYDAASPEDIVGAQMLQMVVQSQVKRTKVELALHTMFRDSLAYGIAPAHPQWKTIRGRKTVVKSGGIVNMLGQLITGRKETTTVDAVLFEGNSLDNIDPYRYLPDPNVSAHNVQDGEYVGWSDTTNLHALLSTEQNDEDMFNVKYLHKLQNRRSQFSVDNSDREFKTGTKGNFATEQASKPVDLIYMYITIIPSEWNLGDSDYPEKWFFVLAADEIIIKCRPAGFDHGLYPIAIAAPDYDGYSSFPMSRTEILAGLQGTLDFLFNSHVANVRKALNDMFVVDPYLLNIEDLKDPKPGKLIRTRRPAWGRGVRDSVMQLQVNDITRQNIGDSSWIVQWMNKIAAADESMMGALRQGGPERLTGAEFQGTRAGAVSRLERIARVIGLQAMQDIGLMFAYNVQQLMTDETFVKIVGRSQQDMIKEYGISPDQIKNGMVKVSPFDILVDFDVVVHDGSIPGANFSEGWLRLFETIVSQPALSQEFDVPRLFTHIARSLGAKDVYEFVRQGNPATAPAIAPKVMPDETVMRQLEAGNLQPV